MSFLTDHLVEAKENYFTHFRHAAYFGFWFLLASLACLTHALFPFLFEKTGSRIATNLHQKMIERNNKARASQKTLD